MLTEASVEIPIQFTDDSNGDSWSVVAMPCCPRIGENVTLPDGEDDEDGETEYVVVKVAHYPFDNERVPIVHLVPVLSLAAKGAC